jgi:hypothetical protein
MDAIIPVHQYFASFACKAKQAGSKQNNEVILQAI